MKQAQTTVISNEQLWDEHCVHGHRKYLGAWLMWLKCPEVASEARPGQFVMVNCGEESTLPRPFSIHRVNDEDSIALFYAVLENGKGTSWLSQRHIGDRVELFGPLGNGFSIYPDSQNLLLIAGGIGIAPLLFLAQGARHQGCSVTLLLGASTATQLYPGRLLPSETKLAIK